MTSPKRSMRNLSLSSFGGTSRSSVRAGIEVVEDADNSAMSQPAVEELQEAKLKSRTSRRTKEPSSTINIKIARRQQRWLQKTAQQVRDNNETAVPPNQRVYPQHLIGAAIDLLKAQDLDWEKIHNIEELRQALDL